MNKLIISLIILFSTSLVAKSIPSRSPTTYFAPSGVQVFINGDYAGATQDLVVNGSIYAASFINGGSLIINGATLINTPSDFFKNGANNGGGNRSIGNNDDQGLSLITEALEAITIDDNGSVGIGITSPLTFFDIDGDVVTAGNLTLNGATANRGMLSVNGAIAIAEGNAPTGGTLAYGKIYVDTSDSLIYFVDNGGASTDLVAAATSVGSANSSLDNLAAVAINTSLISDTNNTDSLGSSTKGWKDLWLAGAGYFAGYLFHDNDTDTLLQYSSNGMTVNAGGEMFVSITENNSQDILQLGNNGDVNVKISAGIDGAVFINGSSAQMGIGGSNTNEKLTLEGIISLSELNSAPSKTDGFGKIYVNGTTTNLCYIDSSGTETDLVNGDGLGATEIDHLSDAIFSGTATSVYMGSGAGEVSTGAMYNTALGVNSLAPITSGDNNTSIGYNSAQLLTSGNGNIAVGYKAGDNLTTGNGNLIIGRDIDAVSASGNNQLNIANLIYGTSTFIGIGEPVPGYNLDVNGTLGITGAATISGTVNKVTITPPTSAATLTLADGSSLITAGAYPLTLTTTNSTSITLPITGEIATLNGSEFFSSKTLVAPTLTGTTTAANITSASGTISSSILVADTKFFFKAGSPAINKYLQAQASNGKAAWTTALFELYSDPDPTLSQALDANGKAIQDVSDLAVGTISSAGSTILVNLGTGAGNDFKVKGTTLVVEGDNSRVGINAVNPAYQLQVNGTLGVTGTSSLAALSATSGSFTTLESTGNFTITNSSTFRVLAASGNTTIGGTLSAGATTLSSFSATSATISGNITSVNNIAATSISSNNGDNGEAINIDLGADAGDDFTIDTNKLVVEGDTGDVGINKAEPTMALDVVGSGFIRNNLTVMGDLLIKDSSTRAALNINNNNGSFMFNGSTVGATAYKTTFEMNNTGLTIGHDEDGRKLNLQTKSNNGTIVTRLSLSANNGDIGIGTSNPSSQLDVISAVDKDVLWLSDDGGYSGCEANPGASMTWACNSDASLKKDINNSPAIIPKLTKFKIKDFTMVHSGERATGVIAQEVQTNFPELVSNGDNGYLRVDSPNQWQLIQALQELRSRNQLLKSIICKDHQDEAACQDYQASNN